MHFLLHDEMAGYYGEAPAISLKLFYSKTDACTRSALNLSGKYAY